MVQIEDESKRRHFLGVGFQREKFHSLSAILVDLAVPLNGKNNHTWAMGVAEAF